MIFKHYEFDIAVQVLYIHTYLAVLKKQILIDYKALIDVLVIFY